MKNVFEQVFRITKPGGYFVLNFGDNGFGYLPYEFVRLGLATDWWTIMTTEWVDLGQFK